MMNESDNIDRSESVVEEDYGLNGADGSTGTDDYDAPVDVAKEGNFDDDSDKKGEEEHEQSSEKRGTYPADCYSFLALHGPIKSPTFFSFGLTVWMFQVRTNCNNLSRPLVVDIIVVVSLSSCIICRSAH